MTIVNKPKLQKSSKKGYDEKVEFHYQCKPTEKDNIYNECHLSRDGKKAIYSIYIPDLPTNNSPTTTTTPKKKFSWIGDYFSRH